MATQDFKGTVNGESVALKVNQGGEKLKIWTYTKAISAADAAAHATSFTITAVTMNNVRSLTVCGRPAGGALYNCALADSATLGAFPALTSTTNVTVYLGTNYADTNIVSITIVEYIA